MKLGISEILKKAGEIQDKQQKIDYLRKNSSPSLEILIRMAFDENLKWAIPEGSPPYKENNLDDQETNLYREAMKLYIFHEGQYPAMKQVKRETKFIQVLELLHPDDAKLVIGVKDKKLPYKWLTRKFVNEVWPGIA